MKKCTFLWPIIFFGAKCVLFSQWLCHCWCMRKKKKQVNCASTNIRSDVHYFCTNQQIVFIETDYIRRIFIFIIILSIYGAMVKALHSIYSGIVFKTIGWLQDQLRLSSFWCWSNEYQDFGKLLVKSELPTRSGCVALR